MPKYMPTPLLFYDNVSYLMVEEMYEKRSNDFYRNVESVQRIMERYESSFSLIVNRCPLFGTIIAHFLTFSFGFRSQSVDWTKEMKEWTEEDCRRIGKSLAITLRMAEVSFAM